jgi:VCBS repeat-containing protein|tara:strand:+ start:4478 stop:4933 length:456 start_codon:yes stop_codon:yes gene_type:complete
MAITTAMCTSFKKEVLEAVHNFKLSGGDTFKLALYAISSGGKSSTTATLGAATTAFTTTGEVASSGSYATGGGSLTRIDPSSSGTTGFTDFSDLSFTTATITARGALIYNSSDSNKAVCALDFGGDKTSTAGTFTITFPAAAASTAIIRIA